MSTSVSMRLTLHKKHKTKQSDCFLLRLTLLTANIATMTTKALSISTSTTNSTIALTTLVTMTTTISSASTTTTMVTTTTDITTPTITVNRNCIHTIAGPEGTNPA